MADDLTHFDNKGRVRMVDVSDKADTARLAVAEGQVVFSSQTFEKVRRQKKGKGDIAVVAELAAIMGVKRTSDLIPLCHPLPITGIEVSVTPDEAAHAFRVEAQVKTTGKTGVEMEALMAVSTACLTIYDMAKAVDKSMVITGIRLLKKTGGKSDFDG
ncbi:MAG: cyclic pyranopterin monophosphate synthase MoaC [Pseudomonadota bacterium]